MFYVFHGDDSHSQNAMLNKLKKRLGDAAMLDLNTTRLDSKTNFTSLRQACDVVPFLAKARLVIVSNLLTSKPDKKFIKDLSAYLPEMPETTRLVFLESDKLGARNPILKLAETAENGYVKLFKRPEGSALARWIQEKVTEHNGRISPRAAHLLAEQVGNDLQILDNEIEKLVLYIGEKAFAETDAVINVEDVMRLSPYAAEANIFDLVDALGNRYGKKAATLLQEKLNDGTEPFYLFAMFVRQFRLLIQVKELADQGERPPAIAKAIRQHSFVVGKLYQQSHHYSMAQLEQIYHHLLDVDLGVKTGQNDMTTSLHLLVAGLTAE